MPELNTRIFFEENEIALSTEKIRPKEGILIKTGKLTPNKVYFADTSLVGNDTKNIFAIILEFEKF